MKSGAQPGNKNAAKAKIWSDALRFACLKDKKRLKRLAEVLVEKASQGDMAALKELGDRLEGRPTQQIEGTGPGGSFILTTSKDDSGVL